VYFAFVDTVKQDGSCMPARCAVIRNPHEVVGVGDVIDVSVVAIDRERGRIGLASVAD
jgi:transcriptional accessory protein Tex/SPT6